MLQQTTVGAVCGRYNTFLRRFPKLATLARAREESVLAAWSGLGYYARARNLHRAAREIARRHGGRLPRDPEALRALPGFGEYMAAAVASLAFGARAPAADANVTRVLSRLFAIQGMVGTRAHRRRVCERAEALLPCRRPGDVTAALMDLGQLVCTPRRPSCSACPLAHACVARRQGQPEAYPRRRSRPSAVRVHAAAACARRAGRALLVRNETGLLAGLWRFPAAEADTVSAARRRLSAELASFGLCLDPSTPPVATQHTIVNRHLQIRVYRACHSPNPKSKIENPKSIRWLTPAQLAAAAIPTLTRKIAVAAGFLPARRGRLLVR